MPLSVTHLAECPDLGPECFQPGPRPTPYYHHVSEVIAETALDASLGVTSWLALETRWSLRVTDVTPTYSEQDGTPKEVPDDIHHHDETLVDAGDPWLLTRLAATQGDFLGTFRLGASFPLGRTEPDPYALGREGKSHEHLQAGTGTVVPIVGFGLSYAIAPASPYPVTLGLSGVGFFNAYENSEGFRAPVRLYANQRTAVSFLDRTLTPSIEVTLAHESEEYWQGEVGLEGSNVRSEVYLGAGLDWRFYDTWSAGLSTRARVATLTDAATFTSYGLFSLSLTKSFDLWDTAEERRAEAESMIAPTPIQKRERDGVVEFEKR